MPAAEPPQCRPFPRELSLNAKVTYVECDMWEDEVIVDILELFFGVLKPDPSQRDTFVDAFRSRPAGVLDYVSGACDRFVHASTVGSANQKKGCKRIESEEEVGEERERGEGEKAEGCGIEADVTCSRNEEAETRGDEADGGAGARSSARLRVDDVDPTAALHREANRKSHLPPTWATAPYSTHVAPCVIVVPGEQSMQRYIDAVRNAASILPSEKLCSLHIEAVSADDSPEFVSWLRTTPAKPHVVFMTDFALRCWGLSRDTASFIFVVRAGLTYPRGAALAAFLAQVMGPLVETRQHTCAVGAPMHPQDPREGERFGTIVPHCTNDVTRLAVVDTVPPETVAPEESAAPTKRESDSEECRTSSCAPPVELCPTCIEQAQDRTVPWEPMRFRRPVPVCFAVANSATARVFTQDMEDIGFRVEELPMDFFDDTW